MGKRNGVYGFNGSAASMLPSWFWWFVLWLHRLCPYLQETHVEILRSNGASCLQFENLNLSGKTTYMCIYLWVCVCLSVCVSEAGETAVNWGTWVKVHRSSMYDSWNSSESLKLIQNKQQATLVYRETLGFTQLEGVVGSISTKAMTRNSGEWAEMESLIISWTENVTEWSEASAYGEKSLLQVSQRKRLHPQE